MSWEANTWATKQRMKLPQEQLVLIMLGNCADPDAMAFSTWPGRDDWWRYLAKVTRLSRSSLFRHINTIVALGLASRSMIVLADGSKRPTIKLNLDVSFDIEKEEDRYLTATAPRSRDESHGETHDDDAADGSENTNTVNALEDNFDEGEAESHGETAPSSPTHGTDPVPPVGLHIDSNIESNYSPLPPSGGTSAPDEFWDQFVRSWGEPIQRMALAKSLWDRTATDKRPKLIAAAKGLWAYRKSGNVRKEAPSAQSFIRDELGWDQWLAYTPAGDGAPVAVSLSHRLGSPEAKAISALYEIAGCSGFLRSVLIRNGAVSFSKPMTQRLLALSASGPKDGWVVLTHQQAGAWEEFLRELVTVATRRPLREDARAPWPWPPRKDGTLSETGPPTVPGTMMTEQDMANI